MRDKKIEHLCFVGDLDREGAWEWLDAWMKEEMYTGWRADNILVLGASSPALATLMIYHANTEFPEEYMLLDNMTIEEIETWMKTGEEVDLEDVLKELN